MRKRYLYIAAILFLPVLANAQNQCSWWPAPCPHTDEISRAQDFVGRGKSNILLPQEATMESNARNLTTDILQKLARQKHWQLYELNESSYDIPSSLIGYSDWEVTPYQKRPPHIYQISFVLVVNRDSLDTWRSWYNDFAQRANNASNAMNASANNANNSQAQAYVDSMLHYSQLRGQYGQDHQAQFLSDIQSHNPKGMDAYNAKMDWYLKKMNAFLKKSQQSTQEATSASTYSSSFDNLRKEKAEQINKFINATVLLINFKFNRYQTGFGLEDGSQRSISPQRKLAVPGAFYAGLLHNTSQITDKSYDIGSYHFVYDNPSDIATILFGAWLNKRDNYNNIPAAYKPVATENDLKSIKKIMCDKIRTMTMQLEGRLDYIKQFLAGADLSAMQKMITAN